MPLHLAFQVIRTRKSEHQEFGFYSHRHTDKYIGEIGIHAGSGVMGYRLIVESVLLSWRVSRMQALSHLPQGAPQSAPADKEHSREGIQRRHGLLSTVLMLAHRPTVPTHPYT